MNRGEKLGLLLLLLLWSSGKDSRQAPGAPGAAPVTLERFPVPKVSSYADTFGHPWGPGRTHQGVDLFAPEGSPVLAPAAGIIRQFEGPRGGREVTLTLPDKTWFLFSHLKDWGALTTGARVKAGDVIGHVGETGNALKKGSHVHFEVHPRGGAAVDPYPLLKSTSVDGEPETGKMAPDS